MAIFHISSIKPSQARGEVKEVYKQLKKEMGDVVEPISMHALIPELLKSNWRVLREALVVEDKVKRKYKEAVASAISSLNDCPYCVDAHTIMMIGLNDKQTAKAIDKQDLNLVQDPRAKELLEWAYNSKYFHSENIVNPPFSKAEAPEIIGTAVFFHYLNRMVTVFLGETILPLNISFLKGIMKKMAAMMFSKVLNEEKQPGKVTENPDMSQFGNPFYWSKNTPRIENALSSFYVVAHQIGEKYIPEQVFNFMIEEIAEWEGSEYVKSSDLEMKLSQVDEENSSLAKMLYLVSFAPYRITEKQINELRKEYSLSDEAILGMFSWASFMTASKIGKELGKSFS